jgi:hypothetical protein
MMKFFCMAMLVLLPPVIGGCAEKTVHRKGRLVSPVQRDMAGRRGPQMPPSKGAPMPSGWRGFKAY